MEKLSLKPICPILQQIAQKYLLGFSRNGGPLASHSTLPLPFPSRPSIPFSSFRRIFPSPSVRRLGRLLFLFHSDGRPEQVHGLPPLVRPAQVADARSPVDGGGSPGDPAASLRSAAGRRVLPEPKRDLPRLPIRETRPQLISGNSVHLPASLLISNTARQNPMRPCLLACL